jgi:hypothetical protein
MRDPFEEAFELAGKARFGKAWLGDGELPPRISYLIRRYYPSGEVGHLLDPRQHAPVALQEEVDRAYDFIAFHKHQWEEIAAWWAGRRERWIRDGSLPPGWNYDQPVPARLLEAALKQDFGLSCKLDKRPRSRRSAGATPTWDWPGLKAPLRAQKGKFKARLH